MMLRQTQGWWTRSIAVVIGLITSGYFVQAHANISSLHCKNNASGYQWSVPVDFNHSKVNSLPAQIGPTVINWYDPSDGGYYDLDSTSGALTVRHASSVGGYFLYDTCHLE